MKKLIIFTGTLVFLATACKKTEYKGKVWFSEPMDGAEITSPVKFSMNIEGMEVKPAGTMEKGTGHFHILINSDAIDTGANIINDATHKHYGKGQREDTLELAPGSYKVTLQFADGAHMSYGAAWAQTINIKVVEKK